MAERPTWQCPGTVADLHNYPLVLRATFTWNAAGQIIDVQPVDGGALDQAAWLQRTLALIGAKLREGVSLESLAIENARRADVIADLLRTERMTGAAARAALASLR